jgi:hypothetical protein
MLNVVVCKVTARLWKVKHQSDALWVTAHSFLWLKYQLAPPFFTSCFLFVLISRISYFLRLLHRLLYSRASFYITQPPFLASFLWRQPIRRNSRPPCSFTLGANGRTVHNPECHHKHSVTYSIVLLSRLAEKKMPKTCSNLETIRKPRQKFVSRRYKFTAWRRREQVQ